MLLTNTLIQDTILKAKCCIASNTANLGKGLAYGKHNVCLMERILLLQRYVKILSCFEILAVDEDPKCLTNGQIMKIIKHINKICKKC
jgi:hypothetical protein